MPSRRRRYDMERRRLDGPPKNAVETTALRYGAPSSRRPPKKCRRDDGVTI
ncbi:MAG: hypothetical protein KIH69_000545 [Anaerolineae bacterium]|nr:hypothetical protein [Anaerolineae bacterium]